MRTLICCLVTLAALPLTAQRDTHCREREAVGSSVAIAGPSEPGESLVIEGSVLHGADRDPAPGARILAYHTDAAGYYSPGGMDERNARLCGVVESDENGRYRIETIRPAHYATGGPPAHVHFEVRLEDGTRRNLTLNFEGDPLLRGRPAGENWHTIRPLAGSPDGGWTVERDLWIP